MSEETRIRLMIVDDHEMVRDGLQNLLESTGDFEVVAVASSGREAIEAALEAKPDVIVMDVIMPQVNGIDACREIMKALPETRVMMLTASNAEDVIVDSVAAGATGYLQKYFGRERLIANVRQVARGEFHIQGDAARRLLADIGGAPAVNVPLMIEGLTQHEQEILRMFVQGMSYAEIAEVKGNQPITIRNTVGRAQRKLGLKTKLEMGVWAVQNGLLE